jgi:glycosyltransferase involved in cell wall biosynthesis
MRVLLLNNNPSPSFDPLFEKLHHVPGWELLVCYSSSWRRQVGWQEQWLDGRRAHREIILDQKRPGMKRRFGSSTAAALSLAEILLRERPDYLICYGYTLKPQVMALLWALITGTKYAMVGDANHYNDYGTGAKRWLRGLWLRFVTQRAAALIAIGTANRLFWESYGARPQQLFEARFAVDNDRFARACEERREEAAVLRGKLGLTHKVVFLFAGRLIKRKNVDLLIRASLQLNDDRVSVVIAGGGEELASLEAIARGNPRIIFAGVVLPADLPLYYAISDVLALPAQMEPWGLVINEAMACGLAIIAHRHCGAAIDLVGPDNGIALESFSVDELARAMKSIASNDRLRLSMQERSREKVLSWSIDSAVRGIVQAVEPSPAQRAAGIGDSVLREEK